MYLSYWNNLLDKSNKILQFMFLFLHAWYILSYKIAIKESREKYLWNNTIMKNNDETSSRQEQIEYLSSAAIDINYFTLV